MEFPSSLMVIGANSLNGCTALSQLELPQGLEYIGQSAFRNYIIQSVTIPSGCTYYRNSFEPAVNVIKHN